MSYRDPAGIDHWENFIFRDAKGGKFLGCSPHAYFLVTT